MTSAAIDFLHPQRTPRLGGGLLALGALALSLALWADRHWSEQRQAFEAAQRQHAEAARRESEAARRLAPPTPQELRRRQIAPQLRQPWLPTLRLIENVTEPPVFLLSLSVDPGTGQVRLDGEAPGFAEALAYTRALDDEAVMGPARLVSHDTVADTVSGRQVVRFGIATRWIAK